MFLVCQVISQEHVIRGSCDFMVSHHTTKFGDHRYCGSGDMMFLVVEGQNYTCCHHSNHANPPLLFISKANSIASSYTSTHTHTYTHTHTHTHTYTHSHDISGRGQNNLPLCLMSGTDHLCLQQQLPKITRKTLASSSKNREVKQQEKKKKNNSNKKGNCKAFYATRKCKKC